MKFKNAFPTLFFLSLLLFGVFAFQNPGVDFRGYYGAALLVRRGGNPYDYTQLAPVLEEISGFQGNNPYFYPPWYCLAFMPLTFLPFRSAQIAWIGINLLLFFVSLEWLWSALDWEIDSWFRWILFTFANIFFGYAALISENSGFVLLFSLAATLKGLKEKRPLLAGFGMALMLTKPQALGIAFLALWFWAWKNQRPAAFSAVGWLGTFLAAATIFFPRWWDFDKTNFGLGIRFYQDKANLIAGKRVAATIYDWGRYFWHLDSLGIVLLAIPIATLGVFLLLKIWKRTPTDAFSIATAGSLLTLLVTPYALQYDFTSLTLVLFLIAKNIPQEPPASRNVTLLLLGGAMIIPFLAALQYQVYWVVVFFFTAFAVSTFCIKGELPKLS